MKNFKKIIILGVIVIGIAVFIIYKLKQNSRYEEIEYVNVYMEEVIEEEKEVKELIYIHINGEVINPGIIKIEEGARIADAIDAAGGLTQNADVNKINLAFILSDGQKIHIPSIYDKEEQEYILEESGENIIEEHFFLKQNNKININTATQTELESLNGIGPSIALKIIKYRIENGKFKNIEEIKNVPGIGEAKYTQIKNDICV